MLTGSTGGACAAQQYSGQHIDQTGIAFHGGINQLNDVKTGDVLQSGNCYAGGGKASNKLSVPIPAGLMLQNLYAAQEL